MGCSAVSVSEKPSLLPFKPAGAADRKVTKPVTPYISPAPENRIRKGDVQHELRQILTSPGARGGYGYNRITLSEKFAPNGIAGEYKYVSYPAAIKQKLEAAPRPVPFRPAYVRKGAGPRGEFAAYEWRPRPSAPASAKEDSTRPSTAPFKPSRTAPLSEAIGRCVHTRPCEDLGCRALWTLRLPSCSYIVASEHVRIHRDLPQLTRRHGSQNKTHKIYTCRISEGSGGETPR